MNKQQLFILCIIIGTILILYSTLVLGTCIESTENPCSKGQVCRNGECTVPDDDIDGVPNDVDKCESTYTTDSVDTRPFDNGAENPFYGCSCYQGAEYTLTYASKTLGSLYIDCDNTEYTTCEDGRPGYCCNDVLDVDRGEFLTDCGDDEGICGPCTGICEKILPGGSLDILFVPVGYSSLNKEAWEKRADFDAHGITSIYPFDQGYISVWRLNNFDIVYTDPMPDGSNADEMIAWVGDLLISLDANAEKYKELCPGIDYVAFLYEGINAGMTTLGSFWSIVGVTDLKSPEMILHEVGGHDICWLGDESEAKDWRTIIPPNDPNGINCDYNAISNPDNPQECDL